MIGLNWAKQRAVRITHILTGLWAESSGHRSQFLNRESAWTRLKSLLWSKEKGITPKKEIVFSYDLDQYSQDEMFDKRKEHSPEGSLRKETK